MSLNSIEKPLKRSYDGLVYYLYTAGDEIDQETCIEIADMANYLLLYLMDILYHNTLPELSIIENLKTFYIRCLELGIAKHTQLEAILKQQHGL